jgi:hypothetical protein
MTSDPAGERLPHGNAMQTEAGLLFHRLNNQLGIILAHAELLEAKSTDEVNRTRARHVITSVFDALGTAREIRDRVQLPQVSAPEKAPLVAGTSAGPA